MYKGKTDDKVLIVTDGTTLLDISSLEGGGQIRHHLCPQGYSVGAIVRKNDWTNPAMFGLYGEAVYVNPATRDVKFIDEANGLSCTVIRDDKLKCVARIYGRKVLWA